MWLDYTEENKQMAQYMRYKEEHKKKQQLCLIRVNSWWTLTKNIIAKSTVKTWAERLNNSGSLSINDNRMEEDKELIAVEKR